MRYIILLIIGLVLISGCSNLEDDLLEYSSFDNDTCEPYTYYQPHNETHGLKITRYCIDIGE